jgi:hypothetical protein
VGEEGCSPLLILGLIQTENPETIRQAIALLHKEIADDEYLQF